MEKDWNLNNRPMSSCLDAIYLKKSPKYSWGQLFSRQNSLDSLFLGDKECCCFWMGSWTSYDLKTAKPSRNCAFKSRHKKVSIFVRGGSCIFVMLFSHAFLGWNHCLFLTKNALLCSSIHLIPKWWPVNYCLVCMFISPLCLISLQNSFVFSTCWRGIKG